MKKSVYIIRQAESDLYKVGFSQDVFARRRELQLGSGEQLSIRAYIETETPRELEKHIHGTLWNKTARQGRIHSEWFYIEADWLKVILFEVRMGWKIPETIDVGEIYEFET